MFSKGIFFYRDIRNIWMHDFRSMKSYWWERFRRWDNYDKLVNRFEIHNDCFFYRESRFVIGDAKVLV